MKKEFFIVAAVIISSQAHAQQDSVKTLEETVITATKYPVKQSQTGKVITVIDRATLDKSEGKTLSQVLNEQAGVIVSGALNNLGTNQTLYLQGAGSGRTLIAIDGVPVSDPSLLDNGFDLNLIPINNIERIEICKGAQSTLYGSDAIAGVINIITIKPDVKTPFNLTAAASGGNYGTFNGNLQLYGKLANQLVYNVRYSKISSTGFSSAYDSTGKGNFDNDGYNGDVVTSNIAWNADSQLTIKSFVQYSRYKADVDGGAFTDAKDYTSTNKNVMLGGGFVYKLSSTTINGNYNYNTSSRDLLEDTTDGQYYYSDNYAGKTQYVEMFASTNLGYGFTLLNGADYRYASANEQSNYGNFSDTSVSQTSMYSSLFYNGKSGLNAELGGRLNTHSRYGSNYTYTFNPSYVIDNNWKIYGSVATGFKAPSLYELYSSYSGNPSLKPETSTTYEAGIQYSTSNINIRINYFNRAIDNGLDYNYSTGQYFNYDNEKGQGIELESTIKLNNMFSVTANYTWLKENETLQSRVSTNDTTYDYALRRPEHTVNVGLNIRPLKKLFINISAHYESKRYDIGPYNTNPPYNEFYDVVLNDFYILNGYAEYTYSDKLKFFVDAKNITNKKFFTIYGYNSIPFMISGGATIHL